MGYEKWSFNGFDLTEDGKWDVEEVIEGLGKPALRGSNLQVPFQHGSRWIKKKFDRKKLVMSMWVAGTDRENLDANIETFLEGIGRSGLHVLQRTMRSGEIREAYAEILSEINFVTKNPGYAKFPLEFELPDPFFYGTTKTVETTVIGTAEKTWTHDYVGSAPCTSMLISLIGPLTNPVLTNADKSVWLQYTDTVATGETVLIDTKYFKCTKGEANMISAIKHGGDAYWMTFEHGANSLKLETDAPGGSVEIEYYPAYF